MSSHLLLQLTTVSFLLLQARAELFPFSVEFSQLLLHSGLHAQSSRPLVLQLFPQGVTCLLLLQKEQSLEQQRQ